MNLLKMIFRLPQAIRQATHFDFNVQDEKLHEMARSAYQLCTEWFGVPADHSQGYKLVYDARNKCIPAPLASMPYFISVKKGYDHDQYASVIAHEMYHRVTIKRPGIRRTWWVDELVAYVVERHVVPELGYADYAATMHERYIAEGYLDARTIKEITTNGVSPGTDREACSLQLDYSIVALGARLEELVGWNNICRIPACLQWEDWLSGLTLEVRAKAVELLDL